MNVYTYTFSCVAFANRFYYRSDHYNFAKNNIPVTLRLEGEAKDAGKIELVGATDIHLKDEDQAMGAFFVVLPRKFVTARKMKLTIGLYDGDNKITTLSTNFAGPFGKY